MFEANSDNSVVDTKTTNLENHYEEFVDLNEEEYGEPPPSYKHAKFYPKARNLNDDDIDNRCETGSSHVYENIEDNNNNTSQLNSNYSNPSSSQQQQQQHNHRRTRFQGLKKNSSFVRVKKHINSNNNSSIDSSDGNESNLISDEIGHSTATSAHISKSIEQKKKKKNNNNSLVKLDNTQNLSLSSSFTSSNFSNRKDNSNYHMLSYLPSKSEKQKNFIQSRNLNNSNEQYL